MLGFTDHPRFNNDLLLDDTDQTLARDLFPSIAHVLDHPELRQVFLRYDKAANAAKRLGHRAGFWAICCVYAALAIASGEYILIAYLDSHGADDHSLRGGLVRFIPAIAALLGIAGIVLGSLGGLFGRRKDAWLRNRLMTERLRQAHFQSLVRDIDGIARSLHSETARAEYMQRRQTRLDKFLNRFEGRLSIELAKMTDEGDEDTTTWLIERRAPARNTEDAGLEPLFEAYRLLRIEHQLDFCSYKLREDGRLMSDAPRQQAALLSNVGLICVGMMFAIHLVALPWSLFAHRNWESSATIVNLSVTLIAFAALAVRSIEHGLQPEREIERYQQYRAALKALLERFDRSATRSDRLTVMEDMERLTVDEMRNFLATSSRTKFVM